MAGEALAVTTDLYFRINVYNRSMTTVFPTESEVPLGGTGVDIISAGAGDATCNNERWDQPYSPVYTYKFIVPTTWSQDPSILETSFDYYARAEVSGGYTQPKMRVTYYYNDAGQSVYYETMGTPCWCGHPLGVAGCDLDSAGKPPTEFNKAIGQNIQTSEITGGSVPALQASLPAGSTIFVEVWCADGLTNAYFYASAAHKSKITIPYAASNFSVYGRILPKYVRNGVSTTMVYRLHTGAGSPDMDKLGITIPGAILGSTDFFDSLVVTNVSWPYDSTSVTQAVGLPTPAAGVITVNFSTTKVTADAYVDVTFTVNTPVSGIQSVRWDGEVYSGAANYALAEEKAEDLVMAVLEMPPAPGTVPAGTITVTPVNTQGSGGQLAVSWPVSGGIVPNPLAYSQLAVSTYEVFRGGSYLVTCPPSGVPPINQALSTWKPATTYITKTPQPAYTDTGLVNLNPYCYTIRAINPVGISTFSLEVCGTPYASPAAPVSLTVRVADQAAGLSWTPSVAGSYPLEGYQVWRSTCALCGSPVFSASVWSTTASSFLDSGLSNGSLYTYKVYAFDDQWHVSNESPSASGTPPQNPPSGLTALYDSALKRVTLQWTAPLSYKNEYALAGYNVYRSSCTACAWGVVATPGAGSTVWGDTDITSAAVHRYMISARSVQPGESALTASVRSMVPPDTPTALTVLSMPGLALYLSWLPNNMDSRVNGYRIYRTTLTGSLWNTASQAGYWATSYLDSSGTWGQRYYYRVSAWCQSGADWAESPPTAEFWREVEPAHLVWAAASPWNAEARLSWDDLRPFQVVSTYQVYRSTYPSVSATVLVASVLTTTEYGILYWTDTTVTNGITYRYWISGLNGGGEGDLTALGALTPYQPPGIPGFLSALSRPLAIDLIWGPATPGTYGIAGYELLKADFPGGTATTSDITLLGAGTTSKNWTTGLSNGTNYYFAVRSVDGNGNRSLATPESFAAPANPPCAPSSLTVMSATGWVEVAWSVPVCPAPPGYPSVTFPLAGYIVYRATLSGGPFASVSVFTGTTATGYVDTDVTLGGTYYYKILSFDNQAPGNVTPEEPPVWPLAPVKGAVPRIPAGAPLGLSVDAGPNEHNGKIKLNWSQPVAGSLAVVGYRVYRSTAVGAPETMTYISGAATKTYQDTGVANGSYYYYRVVSVEEKWQEGNWAAISGTPYADPNIPVGLAVSAGDSTLTLLWTDPAPTTWPVAGYEVYRATFSGVVGLTDLGAVGPSTVTMFIDPAVLVNGKAYYYHLRTWDNQGHISYNYSGQASGTPFSYPQAPTELSALPGTNLISLNWTAAVAGSPYAVRGYRIYRATFAVSPCGGSLVQSVQGVQNWTDNTAANGKAYWYSVAAFDWASPAHTGPCSSTVSETPGVPSPPSAPDNLVLVSQSGNSGTLLVTWNASTPGSSPLAGYNIYRATCTPNPALAAQLYAVIAGAAITYNDMQATAGMVYYYRVRARDTLALLSLPSNELRVFQGASPVTFNFDDSFAPGTLRLIWNNVANPPTNEAMTVTGYQVYRSLQSSTGFSVVGSGQVLSSGGCCAASSYEDGTVTPGVKMYYRFAAVYRGNFGDWAAPWSISWSATSAGYPSVPVLALTATDTGANLSWTASFSPLSVVTYSLYRTTFSGIDPVAVTPFRTNFAGLTYMDMTLTNGAFYYYAVAAVDAFSNSTTSYEGMIFPLGTPKTLSAFAGDNMAILAWRPPPSGTVGIDGYIIDRTSVMEGTVICGSVYGTSSSGFWDAGVFNGIQYTYRVRAFTEAPSGVYYSLYSNSSVITPNVPPSAPASPQAVAGISNVLVLWKPPSPTWPTLNGFRIYRASGAGGGWGMIGSASATTTWYLDNGLTNGVEFHYKVTAIDNSVPPVEGPPSNEVFAIPYYLPNPPTGLTVQLGNGLLVIGWDAPTVTTTFPVTRYYVYRGMAANGEGANPINPVPTAATTYVDATVVNGARYFYKVRSVDTAGHLSVLSTEVSGIPFAPPGVPGGLSLLPGNTITMLKWSAPAAGTYALASYRLYRGSAPGTATTFAGSTTSLLYIDTAGIIAADYYYSIRAVDSNGNESAWSADVSATPGTSFVNPPLNLAAASGNGAVTLNWSWTVDGSPPGGPITGYEVFRSTCPTCGLASIAIIGATTTVYVDNTVVIGSVLTYSVRSIGTGSSADYPGLNVVQATGFYPPGAPTNLLATAGMGAIELTWGAPLSGGTAGVTGYIVLRGSPNCPCSATVATLGPLAMGWTDWGVSNGTTYRYQVRAVANIGGNDVPGPAATSEPMTPNFRPTESHLSLNAFAPARGERLDITYTLDRTSDVVVKAYTLTGIKVWETKAEKVPAGPALGTYLVAGSDKLPGWDGKAADGQYVASGVYIVRIEAGGKTKTLKVIVIK